MLRPDKYILVGQCAMPVTGLHRWCMWYELVDRRVAETTVHGMRISTVFLGLDHSPFGGPKQLFETMVFGKGDFMDELCLRCATWKEAEAQHESVVQMVEFQHARMMEAIGMKEKAEKKD